MGDQDPTGLPGEPEEGGGLGDPDASHGSDLDARVGATPQADPDEAGDRPGPARTRPASPSRPWAPTRPANPTLLERHRDQSGISLVLLGSSLASR